MDYCYKTEPRPYQRDTFLRTRDEEYWAYLLDMGLGKSKITIDVTAWLYATGKITGMLIVAPPGVQRNWITEEIPIHMPDYIETVMAWWNPEPRKAEREAMERVFKTQGPCLHIVAMNYEAFATAKGLAFAKKFLLTFPSIWVNDESTAIKNPVVRTKKILDMSVHAKYRRILTGTPMTETPLDTYHQYAFLDAHILRCGSFFAFKNRFALLQKIDLPGRHSFTKVTGYQRLDELQALIYTCSTRLTTEDAGLDLPEQTYVKRYVELTAVQAKMYADIKRDLIIEASWGVVTAPIALTLLLRLQQIVGGFITPEPAPLAEGEAGLVRVSKNTVAIDKTNPRIQAVLDIAAETGSRKIIIFAKFRAEITAICAALRAEYGELSTVEYHGGIDDASRVAAIKAIQTLDNGVRFLVANRAAARGLTVTGATVTVYFSNEFSLDIRQQSEKRMHRYGQRNPCLYVDLVSPGTVDEKIIKALRNKQDVSRLVTGDNYKEWI